MFEVKLEVLMNFISEHGELRKGQGTQQMTDAKGRRVWVVTCRDERVARGWIEAGLVRVVKPDVVPAMEDTSGNSSGAPTTGRSTATPSFSAPGPDAPSSPSPAELSTQTRSRRSKGGGPEGSGAASS